jgi:hypothetical protein
MNRYFAAAFVACAAASAEASPERTALVLFSADQLKSAYLECDRRAASGLVGSGDAADCSMIHEELKERVFGGNFDRLLAWWAAQRRPQPLKAPKP